MINFDVLTAARGIEPTAENISRVAAVFGAEAASWAFSQWALRERAKKKFSRAEEMLFTRVGLEQSSHERVAEYHASLFPEGARVADLTCGIGGDLIALSGRGEAIGFETDPTTAAYARHNAPDATVVEADCLEVPWDFQYAFADPSRRSGERRVVDPASFSPDPAVLAERLGALKFACMKLSPMLPDSYLQSLSSDVRFVSFGGECREALAVFGGGTVTTAVKVETGDTLSTGGAAVSREWPGSWVYEADPAAIRAHCLPSVCSAIESRLLGDSNGYLTGDELHHSSWVKAYKVLESTAFDAKRVRAILRSYGGGQPEVKSRVKVDVQSLQKRLTTEGDARLFVMLYGVGKSIRCVTAESA